MKHRFQKKTVLVLNGPNLNQVGIREPEHYGSERFQALMGRLRQFCNEKGFQAIIRQTASEQEMVEILQHYREDVSGVVINPASFSHTSIAVLDALLMVEVPKVEVHLSDVSAREDFRKVLVTAQACDHVISGKKGEGYFEAVDWIMNKKESSN